MLTGFGPFNDPVAWDLTEGKVKPEVGKMVQAHKTEYGRDPTL